MKAFWKRAALGLAGMACAGGMLLSNGLASAATIHVVSSGGLAAAFKVLAPQFERESGDTIVAAWGPSMGDTPDTVPSRLKRGEPMDVVIMVGYALDGLVKNGEAVAGSEVRIASSGIGIVVKADAPMPDVSTADALRKALLAAKSIAYSDSASGVYVKTVLFKKLGIEAEVAGKARMIPAEPVAGVVARGEAEIGFQQISELKPVPGITLLGPLPPAVQKVTVFSAGLTTHAPEPKAGRALIEFLASPEAAAAIRDSGMDPLEGK